MDLSLNAVETRIVGVLIEKQMATPDYYPLTLNALVNACNQTTNRDPVMHLDPSEVEGALERLRLGQWVRQVKAQGSRALKYEHNAGRAGDFSDRELALICVLLLRGPQTAGELRSRTGRLAEFHGLAAVEHTLQKLARHEAGPFVVRQERLPGHKENRYRHLFGEVEALVTEAPATPEPPGHAPDQETQVSRVSRLEREVERLQGEIEALKTQFDEFRSLFGEG